MMTTTRATGTTDIIRDIAIIGIMIMAITPDATTIIGPTTIVLIPITTTGATGTEVEGPAIKGDAARGQPLPARRPVIAVSQACGDSCHTARQRARPSGHSRS